MPKNEKKNYELLHLTIALAAVSFVIVAILAGLR